MAIAFEEVVFDGPRPVDGYGPDGFRIGGQWVEGGVFLSPSILLPWQPEGVPVPEDFERITGHLGDIDVVLLGMGAAPRMPEPAVQAIFDMRGVGLEPMETAAACRTYNVLVGEGRRIGAALLPASTAFL